MYRLNCPIPFLRVNKAEGSSVPFENHPALEVKLHLPEVMPCPKYSLQANCRAGCSRLKLTAVVCLREMMWSCGWDMASIPRSATKWLKMQLVLWQPKIMMTKAHLQETGTYFWLGGRREGAGKGKKINKKTKSEEKKKKLYDHSC